MPNLGDLPSAAERQRVSRHAIALGCGDSGSARNGGKGYIGPHLQVGAHHSAELHGSDSEPRGLTDEVLRLNGCHRARIALCAICDDKLRALLIDRHALIFAYSAGTEGGVDIDADPPNIRGELRERAEHERLVVAQYQVWTDADFRGLKRRVGGLQYLAKHVGQRRALLPQVRNIGGLALRATRRGRNNKIERLIDALPVAESLKDRASDDQSLLARIDRIGGKGQPLLHSGKHLDGSAIEIGRLSDLRDTRPPNFDSAETGRRIDTHRPNVKLDGLRTQVRLTIDHIGPCRSGIVTCRARTCASGLDLACGLRAYNDLVEPAHGVTSIELLDTR